jgi:hypothetical protein
MEVMKDSLIQKIKSCSRNIALAASSLGLAGILAAQGGCTYGLTWFGPVVLWNDDEKKEIEHDTLVYKDGRIYKGQCISPEVGGRCPQGFGTLFAKDKTTVIYKGQWERGEFHEFGRYFDENGRIWEGYWDHGRFLGRTKGENGESRERADLGRDNKAGAERKDSPQNRDIQNQRDPNAYDGKLSDGSYYKGQMLNGRADGQGIRIFQDGRRYEGNFKNGALEGQGIYVSRDGGRYEGEFHNGKPDGRAKVTASTGGIYEGEIHNGKRNGRGKYTSPSGETKDGYWKDNEYLGENKPDSSDSSK